MSFELGQPELSAKPAPRQTYGRARAISPSDDQLTSFTVPADSTASASTFGRVQPSPAMPVPSPSKALLNRWEGRGLSFLNSLGELDVGRAESKSDDSRTADSESQDAEELELFVRGLKKQHQRNAKGASARAIPSASIVKSSLASTAARLAPVVPANRLGVSFSSSSLTDLSTSPPPSSPPRYQKKPVVARSIGIPPPREAVTVEEEETFAIRKPSTARPARRRVVESSDEENKYEENAPPSSPSPSPRRLPPVKHLSPPLATARSRSASPKTDADSTPGKESKRSGVRERSTSTTQSDEGEDVGDQAPKPSRADAYLAQLAEENDEADGEGMLRTTSVDSAETIRDPVGSFEAKNADSSLGGSGRKVKPLNRKDHEQLKRDTERARRERDVVFSRPITKALPISSYFAEATRLFSSAQGKEEVPGLERNTHSSPSVAFVTPPDEITAFTPSSHEKLNRRKVGPVVYRRRSRTPEEDADELRQSSPTSHRRVQVDSDGEGGGVMRTNMQILQDLKAERAQAKLMEARRAELTKIKAEAWARQQAERVAATRNADIEDDDELDFTISPVKVPRPKAPVAVRPRGPDAKAVLRRDEKAVPAITKQRQLILSKAGKSARSKPQSEVTSDTYMAFAATTFQHDNLHAANGGSRPAGQKAGRDKVLPTDRLNIMLATGHAAQAKSIRDKKEQDFGRARDMPGRKAEDWDELVEISARRADRDEDRQDEDGEDEEDDDFMPSEEDDEHVDMGSADEADVDEAEDTENDDTGSAIDADEAGTTTLPVADEGENDENFSPIKARRPRHTARFAITSDDEDEAHTAYTLGSALLTARAPLAEIALAQPAALGTAFGDGIDLGGFGDEDGDGFSQLFEATQLNGASAKQDGFVGLRTDAAGLMLPHAVLPQNIVSDTQAFRDNALIAAELEDAEPAQLIPTAAKKQYINDAGFFTQTKPTTQYPTQMPDTARRQLAGSSDISLLNGHAVGLASPDKIAEATERSPIAPSSQTAQSDTPAQDGQSLRRLRRRDSNDLLESAAGLETTQVLSPPAPARERDALSYLMANRRRSPVPKGGPVKTNLVIEQAEESDEDDGWGDTVRKGDDDDEGEDGEGFVEGLVDDQAVDEATKRAQDELAEEKRREMEKQDDTKREEQARRITEGQYRTRRRGQDFYSSGSEDEDGKPKRWNKRQRRLRRLQGEDGLMKLQGEENVFREAYEEESSDDEDILVDEPAPLKSPEVAKGPAQSYRDRREMLRKLGEANRQLDQEDEIDRLDREVGFGRHGTLLLGGEDDEEEESESFSINKSRRMTSMVLVDEPESLTGKATGIRSLDSYAAYVTQESQTNRRGVGISSASVVINQSIPVAKQSKGDAKYNNSRRSTAPGRSGSGVADRLLASKTKSFA